MRRWLSRILSLAATLFLLTVVFQAPQAAATLPSDPSYLNFAAASSGGTATASTWTSGYEPSKAIDESSTTMWRATSTDALLIDFADAYDLREIHIHMATYTMPEVELYLKDGTVSKVFAIVGGFFGFAGAFFSLLGRMKSPLYQVVNLAGATMAFTGAYLGVTYGLS